MRNTRFSVPFLCLYLHNHPLVRLNYNNYNNAPLFKPTSCGCIILRRTIAALLIIFIQERGYNLSLSNSGATMMFVIAVLYVMAIVFLKEYSKTDKDYFILYYMGWFAVFFEILVTSQNIFFRAAFYFLISYVF